MNKEVAMSYAHNLAPASEPVPVAEKVWTVLLVAMLLVAAGYGLIKLNNILHSFDPAPAPAASANRIASLDAQAAAMDRREDWYFPAQYVNQAKEIEPLPEQF